MILILKKYHREDWKQMMTRNNNLEELINIVEEIRAANYPDLPADLVRSVLQKEFELQDTRTQASSEVRDLVSSYLKENRGK